MKIDEKSSFYNLKRMWFQQNAFQTKHIECLWLKPFQVSNYYRLNLCSPFQIWLDGIFVGFWKKAYISTEIPCTGHNCRVSSILNIEWVGYCRWLVTAMVSRIQFVSIMTIFGGIVPSIMIIFRVFLMRWRFQDMIWFAQKRLMPKTFLP